MSRVSADDIATLLASGRFDAEWYARSYPDVAVSGMAPAEHYLWLGERLGRPGSVGAHPLAADRVRQARAIEIMPADRSYEQWLRLYDYSHTRDAADALAYGRALRHRPIISIIMPTYNTPVRYLRAAIESVLGQAYEAWELCIADDCSPDPEVRALITEFAERDGRIKYVFRDQNGNISEATNSALALSLGSFLCFLDHDDVLRPHALLMVADFINREPDAMIFYSDEDKISEEDVRSGPYFKCDWNVALFRSHNLITHLAVYRRDLVERVGRLHTAFDGAQDYDFALRCSEQVLPHQICHIPFILYDWRILPGSTALSADEKPYAMTAGERALDAHLARRGIVAKAELIGIGFRVHYPLPRPVPLVSVLIPTRDGLDLVTRCIESIVKLSTYESYEIILIDNGSTDAASLSYFADIALRYDVRVIRDDGPFNYSALNNDAVRHSRGEYVVLLNNDTEVITPDWIETLIGIAALPDVGAVGPKLLYPDGTVQHGGVIMGLGGVAAHAHTGFPADSFGFAGRLALSNDVSAVTGACLAVRRSTFLAAGGLDARDLPVAYNDVDFCLRLRDRGLRNVYTPFAVLYHHESATRGSEHENEEKLARFRREQSVLTTRWRSIVDHDPAYSPNLSLDDCDFNIAFPPRVSLPWRSH